MTRMFLRIGITADLSDGSIVADAKIGRRSLKDFYV
jgi:hypothetical protein